MWELLFFSQAEDGIRDIGVTGVQTCALPIYTPATTHIHPERSRGSPACQVVVWLATTPAGSPSAAAEIGRAACRERVEISVVAVSLKKKNHSAGLRDL